MGVSVIGDSVMTVSVRGGLPMRGSKQSYIVIEVMIFVSHRDQSECFDLLISFQQQSG
jgi:hypothetical protein